MKGITCLLLFTWLTMSHWTETSAVDHVTSSLWRLLASQRLDAFQAVTRGRSKVECIRECQKYSHCNSFVFNASSHTCYLLPALSNVTDREHLEDKVYVNIDSNCLVDHAPASNGSVKWIRSLQSLVGKVTCYDDFINTTDDVNVQCLADGSWQNAGRCPRCIWRNPSVASFPIEFPPPVTGDWSICIDGIPMSETRFTVDINVGKNSLALHADFRFSYSTDIRKLVVSFMKDGIFFRVQNVTHFPFTVGQPFHLTITATLSGQFQLYVDDNILTSLAQHPDLPATSIDSVHVFNSVNVTTVNLWCQR